MLNRILSNLFVFLLIFVFADGKLNAQTGRKKTVSSGIWRGVFNIRPGLEMPFNFEIDGNSPDGGSFYFVNGEEKLEGGKLIYSGDSLFIPINQFDNELAFKIAEKHLEGQFRKQDKSGNPLSVRADFGNRNRFEEEPAVPPSQMGGNYEVVFGSKDRKADTSVGIFQQSGARLRATFLHITGDSRFLEGIVKGDSFYLSTFIGSTPSLYAGSISQDGRISGVQFGLRGQQSFQGNKNERAALPDQYTLTFLKPGFNHFDFSFPDVNGNPVSLHDPKYKGKVLILTITGTWCPNCMDEASFLSPWFKANHSRGVEAIALYYERKTDPDFVKKVIGRFRQKFDIGYDEVIAGIADGRAVEATLPSLNHFISFPTILFLDKNGNVAKIYTGFTGPATGPYYETFKQEFNEEVDQLLAR